MEDKTKIETKATSVRLPLDVVETLNRWAEETKQSVAGCISTLVRVGLEDEKRITNSANGEIQGADEIQNGGSGGRSVIQIPTPKNRDGLADAITVLMKETGSSIGERDQISALGVARARIYKTTPEYREGSRMRAEKWLPESVYEDEKKLARDLSASGGAGAFGTPREKGDKTR